MIGLRETSVLILAATAAAACDRQPTAPEGFASSAKRLASLPISCSNARVDSYKNVTTRTFSDGDLFELTLDATCSQDWREALRLRGDLICDEDRRPSDRDHNGVIFYHCVDDPIPEDRQIWVTFRDREHVNFLWVKER